MCAHVQACAKGDFTLRQTDEGIGVFACREMFVSREAKLPFLSGLLTQRINNDLCQALSASGSDFLSCSSRVQHVAVGFTAHAFGQLLF